MYPIKCFNVSNEDKIEAVRYYIDLNKSYLKEISKEEYELFVEYLKGEGKEILEKMKEAKTEKELYLYLNRIESVLPYAKNLSEYKSFDKKVNALHKEIANLSLRDVEFKHSVNALKQQRDLAEQYDALYRVVDKYKDYVRQYIFLRAKVSDMEAVQKAFSSKYGKVGMHELGDTIVNAVTKLSENLKASRKVAFEAVRDYSVKEQMYLITQERLNSKVK